MSHQKDIEDRCNEKGLSQFEKINDSSKSASKSFIPDPSKSAEKLCVKKYVRSSADKNFDNPDEIRPPIVIYNTFSYIRDCILD